MIGSNMYTRSSAPRPDTCALDNDNPWYRQQGGALLLVIIIGGVMRVSSLAKLLRRLDRLELPILWLVRLNCLFFNPIRYYATLWGMHLFERHSSVYLFLYCICPETLTWVPYSICCGGEAKTFVQMGAVSTTIVYSVSEFLGHRSRNGKCGTKCKVLHHTLVKTLKSHMTVADAKRLPANFLYCPGLLRPTSENNTSHCPFFKVIPFMNQHSNLKWHWCNI